MITLLKELVYIVNSSNKFIKNGLTAQYYPYQLERKCVLPDYNEEARKIGSDSFYPIPHKAKEVTLKI